MVSGGLLAQVTRAADKAASALQARNDAILAAHQQGINMRAIAIAAKISPSRVHQIIHGR